MVRATSAPPGPSCPFCSTAPGSARRRRRSQRGAALFIVMLAIVMLSGLGMWAMFAAGNMAKASGYARAALQTQYVAEMGLLSTTAYLSMPGLAAANYNLAANRTEICESVNSGSICRSILVDEISEVTNSDTSTALLDTTGLDSFSPFANDTQGDFTVEMTNPVEAVVAGSAIGQSNGGQLASPYKRVTLTSYGIVRPHTTEAITGGNLCTFAGNAASSQNSAAGRIAVRAHAIIGPVN